jgi:penicillin-binding protein 1A
VAVGQAALVAGIDAVLPDARGISRFNRPGTLTIYAADGEVIQKLGPATRDKLVAGRMPELVRQAFIAAEDRRFYQHNGIDLLGISRAVLRNLRQGAVEEGASTITQQLARTVFLSQDRTLVRKLKEVALAGKLERQLSKQQILEQYLNFVYLGSSAYGVADAAWIYFSKTPDELTLPEAALIAGLPPAPSVYSPLVNPDLALQRRAIVLRRMREAGFIDAVQEQEALSSPLALKPAEPKYWVSRAPHFTSWVAQELPKVLTREQIEVGGLTVRTGLNLDWNAQAQKTIDTYASGSMEGVLVALEPGTGLVRAMVGGKDFSTSQFNRAAQALRSPGSTFKLFVYLTALQEGMRPETAVLDSARCFAGYCPKNFGNRYMGRVPLSVALQNSLNTVAVGLLRQLGFDKVIATANSLGITRELGRFYPLAVGATEQTVLDMTAAYAAVNNRGVYVAPTPFEEIYGPDGELLWSRRHDGDRGRRAMDSDIADAMMWMLEQAVRSGTGGGAALPDRAVAGKTGTSEGGRDLWFIGSIPQLTTGVWLGYDDSRNTQSTSVVATYAWNFFMKPVVKELPVRSFPPKPTLTGRYAPARPPRAAGNERGRPGSAAATAPWPDAGSSRSASESRRSSRPDPSRSGPGEPELPTGSPPTAEPPEGPPQREPSGGDAGGGQPPLNRILEDVRQAPVAPPPPPPPPPPPAAPPQP